MIAANSDFFGLAEQKLDWLDQRSRILAGDVANADTPGYVARDLSPFAASLSPFRVTLAATEDGGLAGSDDQASATSSAIETSPDGNGVSLDHTLAAMAATSDSQSLVTTLYRKYVGIEMTALGVAASG